MRVDRIHPALLTDQELDVAVVIDVLRATTTAIALLSRGVAAVRFVATPEDLPRLPTVSGRYLVFSELDDSRAWGLECVDNSPSIAEEIQLDGRHPVLVTTNGTRALAAAMLLTRTVFVAGLVNLSATARHLVRTAGRVTLLPAGDFARRDTRTEDERCADALEEMLVSRLPDLPALLADCRDDPRVQRRLAHNPRFADDLEIALAVDRHATVAAVVPSALDDALDLVRVD